MSELIVRPFVNLSDKIQNGIAKTIAGKLGTKKSNLVKSCLRESEGDVQYNEKKETVNIIQDYKALRLGNLLTANNLFVARKEGGELV